MMSDVGFYLRLLIRRSPAMAALFILCSVIGVVVAFRLPPMYGTSATLLVESAQIADDSRDAASAVAQAEQLEVVQRRLMTRANLLQVARANDALPDLASMTPDEIVDAMQRQTQINRSSGRNQATLMEIRFEAPRPETAAAVVNQYVNLILETNSDIRTELTQGNLEFFRREVQTHSENLEELGQRLTRFKEENSEALPEMLSYNLTRQSTLQEALPEAQGELEALRQERARIERLYERTGRFTGLNDTAEPTSDEARLQELESDLRAALAVYSEQNPRVRLLRSRIDALRADMEADAEAVDQGDAGEEGGAAQPTPLDASLGEIDTRIDLLARKVEEDTRRLEAVTTNIDRTAANRIALESLERDFENAQELYNQAVQNLNQTERQLRIELSARGERISVVEPANVPSSPSSPNRAAIAGLGVVAGLGLAAGLFMLLEVLNQSIRRPQDIQRKLGIMPLAILPRLETPRRRTTRRLLQVAAVLVVLVTVPAGLWAVDTYYMPLDQLYELVRDRLL